MKRYPSDAYFPAYRKQHETAADVGRFWAAMMRNAVAGFSWPSMRAYTADHKENTHE